MHRLIFHHAAQKTQERGGKTAIRAVPENIFGTTDAGLIIRGRAVIYQSVTQPPTVAIQ